MLRPGWLCGGSAFDFEVNGCPTRRFLHLGPSSASWRKPRPSGGSPKGRHNVAQYAKPWESLLKQRSSYLCHPALLRRMASRQERRNLARRARDLLFAALDYGSLLIQAWLEIALFRRVLQPRVPFQTAPGGAAIYERHDIHNNSNTKGVAKKPTCFRPFLQIASVAPIVSDQRMR